ncbi:MAG: sialate O-acetylesterase [Acidobacteria bacterium]|nr:sialate O-acetylesterase [Acidobacteriota bacterium]
MRRLGFLLLLLPALAAADVRLPSLIGDHMLVQRDQPIRLWGWAEPGEQVSAAMAGHSSQAVTGPDGRWRVDLMPLPAGGPHKLEIQGKNKITVDDVLVGEVWVGSGQSNMGFQVRNAIHADKEIASATDGQIRLFQVKLETAFTPKDDVTGEWMVCSPKTIPTFTAVGYFFARHLRQKLNIPVGVIQSAWGGTPAEAWTPRETLDNDDELHAFLERWNRQMEAYPRTKVRFDGQLAKWEASKQGPRPREPAGPGHQHQPTVLYNAMIAPLTPYAIGGAIWYQGENNASRGQGYEYEHLMRSMIEAWRQKWGVGDFPFLFVQLANYARVSDTAQWPELREAQTHTLRTVNTGMAVTIDIGESQDIHPKNKQDVGLRLGLAARAIAYGEHDLVYSGPIYRETSVEPGKLRLWFDHVGSGLMAKGPLEGFQVAGGDGRFHAAEAKIDGENIVVWSEHVKTPVAARYAWADDPKAPLYNKEGLPASPFRTDDWRD